MPVCSVSRILRTRSIPFRSSCGSVPTRLLFVGICSTNCWAAGESYRHPYIPVPCVSSYEARSRTKLRNAEPAEVVGPSDFSRMSDDNGSEQTARCKQPLSMRFCGKSDGAIRLIARKLPCDPSSVGYSGTRSSSAVRRVPACRSVLRKYVPAGRRPRRHSSHGR